MSHIRHYRVLPWTTRLLDPVHMLVAFSSSPRTDVLPQLGRLTRATTLQPLGLTNWQRQLKSTLFGHSLCAPWVVDLFLNWWPCSVSHNIAACTHCCGLYCSAWDEGGVTVFETVGFSAVFGDCSLAFIPAAGWLEDSRCSSLLWVQRKQSLSLRWEVDLYVWQYCPQ